MFGAIQIADFFLQAALRQQPAWKNQPAALIDGGAAKATILQATSAAAACRVFPGLTATQGVARCAHLLLLERLPAQEETAADALLQCAFSCSPWVEATAPGSCTFECRATRLRNETALGECVIAHLASLHLTATVGFAANPDLALLAAQCANPVLSVGDSAAFAADLPLAALQFPADLLAILAQWGIHTAGDFTRLPLAGIIERLGPAAGALWNRAAGRTTRLLQLAHQPPTYQESIAFEHEIETLEPLLFLIRRLLEQLTLRLAAAQRVPEELQLSLTLSDDSEYRRLFRIPSPTCDLEVLFRILHTHLENFTTVAPITALQLGATPALPQTEQFGLFETALRDPNRFYETLARLHALLGPESAGTPVRDDSHRSDRFHLTVPDFSQLEKNSTAATPGESPLYGLPLRRFRPPLAARVTVARQIPVALICSHFSGEIHAVRGPFQTSGNWWDDQFWEVQEWDIQLTTGGLYRLSQHAQKWQLEGVFG